ncbi:glycosyltransferase family 4 protein [Aestuariicoccus sp. MJ-SS9]|uniref:glycosyltransferase family 4 protein n=1 Tax=Aestuariicoccus sp. MJ-SS9 TaxID=3079855 RepID=UPI00290948FE|nr:glycosyltransferase family 4 protein [Aestuariicoccus sp. MJ-SS9]MDU8911002.1 glycosyltransferase family 4 protein [Aestuariicoccus sp. MJ-SS9]
MSKAAPEGRKRKVDTPTHKVEDVVIVGDFADITGGQAKVAIDSARLLADAGIRVTFFAACGPVSPLLDHPRIEVVCLNQLTILDDPDRLRAMRRGLWNGPALSALRKTIEAKDPERCVLHCHGYAKALSPAIGRTLARGPLRSVFTMHEYFLACPNGGFFNYPRNEICTLRPLGPACLSTNCDSRRAVHKAWRVARGFVARGPGLLPGGLKDVIYISETQRRAMAPYLPSSARLHHVSNPVEPGGPHVDVDANKLLVFVGRLAPEKGGLHLAQAARRLGLPVLFVGDGPEAEAILAANPDAEITGWVRPEEVQLHLSQARALVFPSLWYEGQPLVPIEALLRGIPVVCGMWSAAAETVRDGEDGLIYQKPSVDDLAAALKLLPTLGAFDSGALAEEVSPQAHLRNLLAIYDEMLTR